MMLTMCPFCSVEHESIQAMGTTVACCPKMSDGETTVLVHLPKRLTPELESNYLRAAVALEEHVKYRDMEAKVQEIARRAWNLCRELKAGGLVAVVENCDNRAARLLRDCVAKSEPLP